MSDHFLGEALLPDQTRLGLYLKSQVRGLVARQQLAEAEGGSLSSDEMARLLAISKTAVLKRLATGRLLAWRGGTAPGGPFPALAV